MNTKEIPVIRCIKKEQASGVFEYTLTDGSFDSSFTWTGYTYKSIAGAKNSLASQIKKGFYGSEAWGFIIVETTFITLTGYTWVDVHTYERQEQASERQEQASELVQESDEYSWEQVETSIEQQEQESCTYLSALQALREIEREAFGIDPREIW